jgi:pyruvate dehydrogenase E1 component
VGQRYSPEDIDSILSYREATDGQILEEGISEAGAIASWTAAATSYSVHGLAMLPFYIYYSMFGFQRVGDQIWAAADQRRAAFFSERRRVARRWAARDCSTRTVPAT